MPASRTLWKGNVKEEKGILILQEILTLLGGENRADLHTHTYNFVSLYVQLL